MGRTIFGILLGVALAPFALLAWFYVGHPPVAVADPPLPLERWFTAVPLKARIHKDPAPKPPVEAGEQTYVNGAEVYRGQCASCHGFHSKPSRFASQMFPLAPQLWEKHPSGDAVGVSDDPVGETYWKIANGIRLTGMPAYRQVLSDQEIWEVTLLLANANKPLPPSAVDILDGKPSPAPSPIAPPTEAPASEVPAN